MTLNDFFLPLNLFTILQLILFLLFFDIIGFSLRYLVLKISVKKEDPISYFRLVDWWWGACFFTAIWVGLHFYLPFHRVLIWLTAILLTLISLKPYLKANAHKNLLLEFKIIIQKYWLSIIPLLLLLKPLYFKISLPPNIWDEMAYHIWSPARILFEQEWEFILSRFTNVIYEMFPRTWETLMIILFSATHSYAVGKFFQVFLMISVVILFARFFSNIYKNHDLIGNFWIFLTLFIGRGMVYQAATAYIDIGAAVSFLLILVTAWLWFENNTKYRWLLMCMNIGAAMGTKYSVLPGILSVLILLLLLTIKKIRLISNFTKKYWIKLITASILVWFIFGGYWYLKNLIVSGNPFWPFFNYALGIKECCDGRMVIEGWGYLPFTYENRWKIADSVFGHQMIQWWVASFFFILIGFVLKAKDFLTIVKIYIFLFTVMFIEILLSIKGGLFAPRFYQHWYFYKYIFLILPLGILPGMSSFKTLFSGKKSITKKLMASTFLGLLWIILLFSYLNTHLLPDTLKNINEIKEFELNENDRWVVREKMSVIDWIHPTMPHAFPMIVWCSDASDGLQDIYTADIETIIGPYGLSRTYLTRCLIKEVIALKDELPAQTFERIVKSKQNFVYFSSTNCKQSKQINPNALNTVFVCNGEEFKPQLYHYPLIDTQ